MHALKLIRYPNKRASENFMISNLIPFHYKVEAVKFGTYIPSPSPLPIFITVLNSILKTLGNVVKHFLKDARFKEEYACLKHRITEDEIFMKLK